MIPNSQKPVANLLAALSGTDPAETHISAVFVGKDEVWKLKKAVQLSFLDFEPLEARHRYALRELTLNQPAAPGLYRDVVPVVRREDGTLALEGEGEVVDWVLRMARVPKGDFFDRIAGEKRLDAVLLDRLADAVAAYHAGLPEVAGADSAAGLRRTIEGNAGAALGAGLDRTAVAAWQREALAALTRLKPRLIARRERVRRAHGDLHLGNLCLWEGRPVPFDALEFDEDLATIDLGYDLAFLLMDLERRVDRAAANRVLNRYVDATGDAGLVPLLPLFLSLRAMVRAHVEAASQHRDASQAYLLAAQAYLRPVPSLVIAVGGLPGTGKSTLARKLAPGLGAAPGALVLRSDTIRKRQQGVAPEVRLSDAAYGREANAAVIDELLALTRDTAAGGHAVIADATFRDLADRRRIADCGAPFVGIWLQADFAVLEARIAARTGDPSDATPALLRKLAVNDPGAGDWLAVDAADADTALRLIEKHLAMQGLGNTRAGSFVLE